MQTLSHLIRVELAGLDLPCSSDLLTECLIRQADKDIDFRALSVPDAITTFKFWLSIKLTETKNLFN